MSKKIFITGTDTDIGKTYVSGLIVKKLHESGASAAYYKAAMSGNERDADGTLIPGDALFVKETSGIPQPLSRMCPYVYEAAVSPHLAAKLEGNPVRLWKMLEGLQDLLENYEYITMEGSGGILCPICFDGQKLWLEDIINACSAPCLLVADAGLGTINSVGLTAFYMKEKGIPLKGIIFNNYIPGDVMHEDNVKMCEYLTGLKVLACVKHGDTDIDIPANTLMELYE